MSLNNQGIGVGLSLKDNGFDKGIGQAQKQVSAFGTAMDGVKMVAGGMGSLIRSALTPPKIGPSLSLIQTVANDFKLTTTGVEAFGVAASKAFSESTAGLNLSAKEARKWQGQITSLAYNTGMDVGTITASFKALQQSGVDVTKIGFKSFGEYQKFLNVTGTDAKQFAATIGKMRSQFHMTDDQIKDTVTSVVALGKHFNMGAEATQGMAATVGMLADEGASLWAELGPDKTKQFMVGAQSLSVAFLKAGHSADEAQGLALGVGKAMIQGEAGVQQLYSGLQEDLPDAMQTLTENFGDVNAAFKTIQSDPGKFAKSLAVLANKIKSTAKSPEDMESKMARFSNQLGKTYGPQFSALIGGSLDSTIASFDAVDKELSKPGGLADKNGVLSKIAANFKPPFTASELFDRAVDQFKTHLKGLMHESDQDYLKRVNHSFDVTSNKLNDLSKKNGPIGKVAGMLEELAVHGLGGVASKISSDYGPAVAVMIQQFGPLLQYIPMVTAALGALFSPMTLVVGAIAALALYFNDVSNGGGTISKFFDNLGPKIDKFVRKISNFIDKIDWDQVGIKLADAIERVAPAIEKIFAAVYKAAKASFLKITKDIADSEEVQGAVDTVFSHMNASIATSWMVPNSVKENWKAQNKIFQDTLTSGFDQVRDKIADQNLVVLKHSSPQMLQYMHNVWGVWIPHEITDATPQVTTAATALSIEAARAMTSKIGNAVNSIIDQTLGQGAVGKIKAALGPLGVVAGDIFNTIAKGQAAVAKKTAAAPAKAAGAGVSVLQGAAAEMNISVGDAADLIKTVSSMSPGEIQKTLGAIKTSYIGFLRESAKESKNLLDDTRKYYNQFILDQKATWSTGMVDAIGGFTKPAADLLTIFWTGVIKQAADRSKDLVNVLGGAFSGMGAKINVTGFMGPTSNTMAAPSAVAMPTSTNPLDNLMTTINYPSWVHDMKKQMTDETTRVVKAVDMLTELTAKKITPEQQKALKALETNGDNANG